MATAAGADGARRSDESPFRFQFEQKQRRRLGGRGYVYNALPWRITNVRVQVDSVDPNGTVVGSPPAGSWEVP